MKVLLVDDNQQVMETLTDYLELAGVQVDCAYNGVSALSMLKQQSFDVIVMDIMMPKLDGISTVQQIRQELLCQTPVLFLTAKDGLVDKEAAFEAGGDDYLVKPFALKELQLRLEALSKRGMRQDLSTLVLGDLTFDLQSLSASKGDRPLKLSRIQLQILKVLLQKSPAVVSRQYLTEQIWGDEEPASDVLRSHVYAIRNQLSPQQERPVLETLHGQGYKLVL